MQRRMRAATGIVKHSDYLAVLDFDALGTELQSATLKRELVVGDAEGIPAFALGRILGSCAA